MHPLFDERRYLIPFRSALLPQIFTDVLVIGAGVAGMRAALAAAQSGAEVIVTTKAENTQQSNTAWAQGGIATVIDEADSFASHIEDTLVAGAGLCDPPVVRAVVEGGPPRIKELIDWGMRFDRVGGKPDGKIALGREGGHERSRILHADGDATGRELAITLERVLRTKPNIRLFTNCFVLDLITIETTGGSGGAAGANGAANGASGGGGGGGGRCVGAITHHPKYGLQVIWAHATILASGGSGQVWRESTNPGVATGDGIAMAYRAGAVLADMAFMQFHPTTLYIAGAARSLITEAVRGEGAHLLDRHGRRFMPDYHPMAELAPRDIVSRAILAQMAKTNHTHVYLDARHIGSSRFAARFPGIFDLLKRFDIDPGQQPIPIHPSAHYMIGGALTDLQGRTNITGLYACGEAACSGLHGANRLASNSLLEGLVYGAITGKACREMFEAGNGGNGASSSSTGGTGNGSATVTSGGLAVPAAGAGAGAGVIPGAGRGSIKIVSDIRPSDRAEMDLADVRSSLRSAMWRQVGIEREGDRLKDVVEMFNFWASYTLDKIFDDRAGWEVQNMLLVGALVTRSALWRDESRGTHYRLDRPTPRDDFRVHDTWQRGRGEPIPLPIRNA